jgi:hypothetical protein
LENKSAPFAERDDIFESDWLVHLSSVAGIAVGSAVDVSEYKF